MRRLKGRPFLTAALLAALVIGGCAQTGPSRNQQANYTPPTEIGSNMADSLSRHRAAAISIGVIRDGTLVWNGIFGEQGQSIAATNKTMFNVASLAKPITAELTMRLVSAGKISLDEIVSDTFVDADLVDDPRHRKLTPRLLLSHQSGLPNWRFDRSAMKLAFIADPGTAFTYSGEGYEYLRRFIEKKTGRSFESLVQQIVFDPIGMKQSSFSEHDWMRGNIAQPKNRDGEYKGPDLQKTGKPNAADNLFTTVEDYAAFMLSMVRNDSLSREVADQRQRVQIVMPPVSACQPKTWQSGVPDCPTVTNFTLGWTAYHFGERVVLSNSGMDWGEFALVYIDAKTRDGMLFFVNGGNGVPVVMDAMALLDADSPVAAFGRAQMRQ